MICTCEPDRNLVVARFKDGRVCKGITRDFSSDAEFFHISGVDPPPGSQPRRIWLSDLKALFWVKDLNGNPHHPNRIPPQPEAEPGETLAVVRFNDDEILPGHTLDYAGIGKGFFLIPAEPEANNTCAFVLQDATRTVRLGRPDETISQLCWGI